MPLDFPPVDVVCVCYDMGGTNVFKSVTDNLKPRGYDYALVVMGTAAENAVKTTGFSAEKVHNITKLGSATEIPALNWHRTKALPERDVIAVVDAIKAMKPEVIIFEAVSKVQHQIAEALSKDDNFKDRICVYYDNVNMGIHDNPNYETILRFVNSNFTMLLPTYAIKNDLAAKCPNIDSRNFAVVGHPGIEAAVELIEDLQLYPNKITKKLHLDAFDPVVSYLGGYENGYEKAFKLFAQQIVKLRQDPVGQEFHLIVTLHPKMKDEKLENLYEYKILEEYGIENYTIVHGNKLHRRNTDEPFETGFETFVTKTPISSREVIAISDLVLSQSSTMIPEARLTGAQAHFVNPCDQKNTMVTNGLCLNFEGEDALLNYFKGDSQNKLSKDQLFEKAQLVRDSAEKISNILIHKMPSTREEAAI